ncbi:hypothetical protein E0765_07210 [Sulfuricurvum sp. IAE1]|uniref:hypothetical protein n=1 Tax=Sulfuricurvum sp. IAE1 TaxID=2546102 RepID=UPI0010532449|nr:hypothetical protein [Sulfuricurvum sp. IAE1]TDA63616.1 hypothetical protein E0765_07210 [Sulfuricurvum sp. IAE1]
MLIDARTTTPDYFGTQAALNARKPQPRRSAVVQVELDAKPNGFVFRFAALAMIGVTAAYIGFSTFSWGVAVVG